MLNKVKFDKITKKVVLKSDSYFQDEQKKWHVKEELQPQRYINYKFEDHIREGNFFNGVALPSKDAENKYFQGVICFDLDSREGEKRNIWLKVVQWFKDNNLISNNNMEYKGESLHIWVKMDIEKQIEIVKGNIWKTSGKLYISEHSSIDLIFGGKSIRTAGSGGYCIIGQDEEKEINFDLIPYMSTKLLEEFVKLDIFVKVDIYRKKRENKGLKKEYKIRKKYEINVKLNEMIKKIINVERLEKMNSYSEHTKHLHVLKAIEFITGERAIETYMSLFSCSTGGDEGLIRGYENIDINSIDDKIINIVRYKLDLVDITVKNEIYSNFRKLFNVNYDEKFSLLFSEISRTLGVFEKYELIKLKSFLRLLKLEIVNGRVLGVYRCTKKVN